MSGRDIRKKSRSVYDGMSVPGLARASIELTSLPLRRMESSFGRDWKCKTREHQRSKYSNGEQEHALSRMWRPLLTPH